MQVFRGVCSFGETDEFVLVSIGDVFSHCAWNRLESVVRDLTNKLLQSKSMAIVLDLSSLSHASSSVVAAILRIWKRIVASGGRVVVLAPSERTRGTLDMAGLTTRLPIANDPGGALHLLGLSPTARVKRRETMLLKCVSPLAAVSAVLCFLTMHFTLRPAMWAPSIAFVLITSAVVAGCGGILAATRENGLLRSISTLTAATGFLTLVTAIGQWSVESVLH